MMIAVMRSGMFGMEQAFAVKPKAEDERQRTEMMTIFCLLSSTGGIFLAFRT